MIRIEDRELEARFGHAYRKYRQRFQQWFRGWDDEDHSGGAPLSAVHSGCMKKPGFSR